MEDTNNAGGANVLPFERQDAQREAETLARKLAEQARENERVLIEIKRVVGSGRGAGGSLEAVEVYEWDTVLDTVGAVLRKLEARCSRHGGGEFRLIVRDDESGTWVMNQGLRVRRAEEPAQTQATPVAPAVDGLARLAEAIAEGNRQTQAMLAQVLNKPAPTFLEELEKLRAVREALGGIGGEKGGGTLVEQLRALKETQETLADLGIGGGDGKGGAGWPGFLDKWMPRLAPALLAMVSGDDDGEEEGDDDGGGEPAGAQDAEAAADEQKRARNARLRALLIRAADGLVMASAAGMDAKATAAAALQYASPGERKVLIRAAGDGQLVTVLLKLRPALVERAAWVEQVRQELGKRGGNGASGEVAQQAGATGAGTDETGNSDQGDADTGRAGGNTGDAAGDARPRKARKGGPRSARAGAKGDGGA